MAPSDGAVTFVSPLVASEFEDASEYASDRMWDDIDRAVSTEVKLEFYALHQQAVAEDETIQQPGAHGVSFQPQPRYKWDKWEEPKKEQACARKKHLTQEEAMLAFIELLKKNVDVDAFSMFKATRRLGRARRASKCGLE